MRAVAFSAPGVVGVQDVDAPVPAAGEVLVAPRWVGLCGTDLELLDGSMPYFAQGLAEYPLRPGHEVAGIVVDANGAAGFAPGDAVVVHPVITCGSCAACRSAGDRHAGSDAGVGAGPVAGAARAGACRDPEVVGVRRGRPGGAAELLRVPPTNLHPVPAGLALREAVLAEPGVTAHEAVERSGATAGARALVIGPGTLGVLAAQLLRERGVDVDLLIADEGRRGFVEQLGIAAVTAAGEAVYDAVIEAAGTPAAVHAAFAAVAPGGDVGLIGVQRGPIHDLDVNAVVLKDVTVHAVGGPGDFPGTLARLASGDFPGTLTRLASGAVDASALIDREFDLADAPAAFARLADPERPRPKVLLRIADDRADPTGPPNARRRR